MVNGRRWHLAAALGVTFFVAYLDRLNITFAVPLMALEFGWDEAQTQANGSLLMGLFYAGYGIANIFLSPFAARLGARRSLMLIVVLWSLFTALGAWLSQFLVLLMATRVLLGLSEGVHVPMMSQLTKTWFPMEERARANSVFVSGLFLAVLLSPLLLVPLMDGFGWRTGFLVLAAVGLVVSLPLVLVLVRDFPEQDPRLSALELAHIQAGREREAATVDADLDWKQLLRMPSFVLLVVIGMGNNIVALGFSSWLPTYFTQVRGIDFAEIGTLVALPYAFSLLGIGFWAYLGDRYNLRAALAGLGFACAGGLLFLALNSDSLVVVMVCFCAAVFTISSYNACEFAMVQRIVPESQVATAMGIYNGLATIIGGGLGPLMVSPLIAGGEGSWMVCVLAAGTGLLLLQAWRILRY